MFDDVKREGMSMFARLDGILHVFRPCFSGYAAFTWFVVCMVGFFVRCDHEGLSSIVRWLALPPNCYDAVGHFFVAKSWNLPLVLSMWAAWVAGHCPLMEFNGRPLLIGDGIKVAKEAKRMPGVKSLHQDSDNNRKKTYINGQHVGVVGLLIGTVSKAFCLPLEGALHEGVNDLRPEDGLNGNDPTLITRMATLLMAKATALGHACYATVDAYFAVGPMFLMLQQRLTTSGTQLVHLITRAKNNSVAYPDTDAGRAYKKSDKVKLMPVFEQEDLFSQAELTRYGVTKTVQYYCVNLVWEPVAGLLRFVLVNDAGQHYILMCSDLTLDPLTIITIYAYRMKIEVMFDVVKNLVGGFCYHFWSTSLPKLKRGVPHHYATLARTEQKRLSHTLTAIERFINLAAMAVGMLQYLSLTAHEAVWDGYHGWLRTYSSAYPSERVVQNVLRSEVFHGGTKVPCCRTFEILQHKQRTYRITGSTQEKFTNHGQSHTSYQGE
jgi:hypothetical protein